MQVDNSMPYKLIKISPLLAELSLQITLQSSKSFTRKDSLQDSTPVADKDQPVSRRFEPSSRSALMSEQDNPWDLFQPQDAKHITLQLLEVQTISSPYYALRAQHRESAYYNGLSPDYQVSII